MSEKKNEQQNINIELTDEIANGQYSNLAIINHSPTEFVVDFVNLMPGLPKAKVQSRIILTPFHAKRLMMALQNNVVNYEKAHGVIEDKGMQANTTVPFSMSPKGEA
jgi:hypothetical protein